MLKNVLITFLSIAILLGCKSERNGEDATALTGDTDIDFITQKIEIGDKDPDLYFERAKLYYERQSYDEAIQDIQTSLKIDSLKPDYYHLLSDVYLDYYQSRKALETMLTVRDMYPNRIASLLKLSELQFFLKQYDNSILTVNDILGIDPQNADAYLMLGLNFRDLKENRKAINSFQTAVEINPEIIDAWILLGELYASQDDPRALQFFDNAIRMNPKSTEALHSKAYYLQNNNQLQDALKVYRDIKAINSSYSDAYLNAGILYIELDSMERAFEEFNIMVNVAPQNYLAYYYRGQVYELQGNFAAAKTDYINCLNLNEKFQKGKVALERVE